MDITNFEDVTKMFGAMNKALYGVDTTPYAWVNDCARCQWEEKENGRPPERFEHEEHSQPISLDDKSFMPDREIAEARAEQ